MPDDLDAQIREKERELAELRGQRPRPLTLAEIRHMSKEEVDAEWERVKTAISNDPVDDDKITHSGAKARLERGYEQQPDGMTVRRQRRNDLGGADE